MIKPLCSNFNNRSCHTRNDSSLPAFKGIKLNILSDEFRDLERSFIDAINFGTSKSAPASVLIAFKDDLIKKILKDKLKRLTEAEFRNISGTCEEVITEINNALNLAKQRYINLNKRTVLVIDDAEKLIGISPAYAKTHNELSLDIKDMEIVKNSKYNISRINYFKTLLDSVSELPASHNDSKRSATTMLFFTKRPHLIHPDLISRDGKMHTIFFPEKANTFDTVIYQIPYNGKELIYDTDKKARLYYGDLGYNNNILWAEPPSRETLEGVLDNLELIKKDRQFENVKKLQMGDFEGMEYYKKLNPVDKQDAQKRRIFEMLI